MSTSTISNDQQSGVVTESQRCIAGDATASQTTINEDDILYYNEAGLSNKKD